jgi:2'-5' RNA ligase
MRIFIGIDLGSEVRTRIKRFVEGVAGFAPEARWIRPESLHVTLKFVGEQSPQQVDSVRQRLQQVESGAFEIRIGEYGFFPTAKAPRVFWVGIDGGPQLSRLAQEIDMAVGQLGVAREDRPYSPHLTLARASGRSGSPKWRNEDRPKKTFAELEKRLAAMSMLDLGTAMANEFILYQSQPLPNGSIYTKLQIFPLSARKSSLLETE